MCEPDKKVKMPVPYFNGENALRWKYEEVDVCISGLVQALNNAGFYTVDSCCGHGESVGYIKLKDGRVLAILSTQEEIERIYGERL